MPTSLDVRGLTVELPTPSGWVRPENEVSFTLARGETLGIVGESGSGKTMLSLALMGLEPHGARRKAKHGCNRVTPGKRQRKHSRAATAAQPSAKPTQPIPARRAKISSLSPRKKCARSAAAKSP